MACIVESQARVVVKACLFIACLTVGALAIRARDQRFLNAHVNGSSTWSSGQPGTFTFSVKHDERDTPLVSVSDSLVVNKVSVVGKTLGILIGDKFVKEAPDGDARLRNGTMNPKIIVTFEREVVLPQGAGLAGGRAPPLQRGGRGYAPQLYGIQEAGMADEAQLREMQRLALANKFPAPKIEMADAGASATKPQHQQIQPMPGSRGYGGGYSEGLGGYSGGYGVPAGNSGGHGFQGQGVPADNSGGHGFQGQVYGGGYGAGYGIGYGIPYGGGHGRRGTM